MYGYSYFVKAFFDKSDFTFYLKEFPSFVFLRVFYTTSITYFIYSSFIFFTSRALFPLNQNPGFLVPDLSMMHPLPCMFPFLN